MKERTGKSLVTVVVFILALVLFSQTANAFVVGLSQGEKTVCLCNNCTDCTNALNSDSCDSVKLTVDIINYSGTCINNPANFNNKIFDCQGHKIDGDSSGRKDYGIYLNGKSNNTIKNCVITNFYDGIYLDSSSHNTLTNNTAKNNNWGGIYLDSSSHNTLTNNTAKNNYYNGIYLGGSSNNTLTNNIAKNNTNSAIACGINLETSSNNTLINNIANNNNNGFFLGSSSKNNILINNTANNNKGRCEINLCGRGFSIYSSSNNTLTHNTANYNQEDGIWLRYSSHNTLTNNTANNNNDGIHLYSSSNNTLTHNTANNNGFGIYIDSSSYNTLTHNIANKNSIGIKFKFSSNHNTLIHNIVKNSCGNGISIGDAVGTLRHPPKYNTLINNIIKNSGENGIILGKRSSNNTINANYLCLNRKYDLYNNNKSNNTLGYNNTGDTYYKWNDKGVTGFTYSCPKCYVNDAGTCTIKTGEGCNCINQALNDANCTFVKLNSNIEDNCRSVCIGNIKNFNNKILDCQGHTIFNSNPLSGGPAFFSSPSVGILLNKNSGNTIKNCKIVNFKYGLYLKNYSSNNKLINNAVYNNSLFNCFGVCYGIYLTSSLNNTLINNKACIKVIPPEWGSSWTYSVDIYDSSNGGNTGANNRCDNSSGWNDQGTTGCKFSCKQEHTVNKNNENTTSNEITKGKESGGEGNTAYTQHTNLKKLNYSISPSPEKVCTKKGLSVVLHNYNGSFIYYLDGKPFNASRPFLTIQQLTIGQHNLRIIAKNYLPITKTINVLDCSKCGDGVCTPETGENSITCCIDCGSQCGDSVCNCGENKQNCVKDCNPCSEYGCGDGVCRPECGETSKTCPQDCTQGGAQLVPNCVCDFTSPNWHAPIFFILTLILPFLVYSFMTLKNRCPSSEKADENALKNYLSKALIEPETEYKYPQKLLSTKYSISSLLPTLISKGWANDQINNAIKNIETYKYDYIQLIATIAIFVVFATLTYFAYIGKLVLYSFTMPCSACLISYLLPSILSIILAYLALNPIYRIPSKTSENKEILNDYVAKILKQEKQNQESDEMLSSISNLLISLKYLIKNTLFYKISYEKLLPFALYKGWTKKDVDQAISQMVEEKYDFIPIGLIALTTAILLILLKFVGCCNLLILPWIVAFTFGAYLLRNILTTKKLEEGPIIKDLQISSAKAIELAKQALEKKQILVQRSDLLAEKIDYQGHQFWRVLTKNKSHEVILDLKGKVLRAI